MARKLFEHGSSRDWFRRSVIAGGSHYDRAYIPSFYEAAETLVQAVLQHNGPADLLFCPTIHLYHHFVELALKQLIVQADGCCTDTKQKKGVPPGITGTHSLKRLLDWLIERLEAVDDKEPFDDGVRVTIEQLHSFNGPSGENTRYAFNKGGKRTLPTQQQFDIEIVRDRMEEVDAYLCGIGDWLDSLRETW
jgi:hypothetical protein